MGSFWVRNGFVFLGKFRGQFFVTPCQISVCHGFLIFEIGFVFHNRGVPVKLFLGAAGVEAKINGE